MTHPTINVPKDLTHWPQLFMAVGGSGRAVSDELLHERFAFAGEVKLTRSERSVLLSFVNFHNNTPTNPAFDEVISKLRESESLIK